ncbi:ribosome small subunit-dependent GTPase A [Ligilactobacillus sp. LYQ139]|uniref:ribosome small subunit-dependent GTPase A n=1 Tax=Ligilactobacillus sp. LYQ139 TaxID=3378800 RepID=UPI0038535800
MEGQVRQSLSGYYDVESGGHMYRTRARGKLRQKRCAPLVGDRVEFKVDKGTEYGYLLRVFPRKNELVRPPVANIDCAIVVTAAVEPAFNQNLLDRQLIMLTAQQITPVLYFSKGDLMLPEQRIKLAEKVAYYQQFYRCFFPAKMDDQDTLTALRGTLTNQVAVVMGQTGAGKSTLLNQLAPELALETGTVSKALSRGKHTTRRVTLLSVGTALIADTPGFSSFELRNLTRENVPGLFPEFTSRQIGCKFRGCLHLNEPSCAVKAAVDDGQIDQQRYADYVQFQDWLAHQRPRYGKNRGGI